jgi:NADH dehydrogenase/NADH:ubiquinone oxidoreductase subunit G
MAKVNLDKLQAVSNGNIESVTHTAALENGALIALGNLKTGERELMEVKAPANTDELLLVATSEMHYDESKDDLDYTNPANSKARAYHFTVGDKFQAEQALFAVAPAVGDVVTGNATFGYAVNVDSRTTFVVEALTKFGYDRRDMARLRVLTV